MKPQTFYLEPVDSGKSFGNKCHVNKYDSEGEIHSDLISYETRVAHFNHTTSEISVYGYYSPTTARHINAFLDFYGFDTCTKKELENYK